MARKTASILVFNKAGKILLQKRDNIPSVKESGKWDFWGGRCEEGETYERCAARELEEEIGITVENFERLKFVVKRTFFFDTDDVEESLFAYFYKDPGKPPVYEGEGSEWFSPYDVQKFLMAFGGQEFLTDENIEKAKKLLSL